MEPIELRVENSYMVGCALAVSIKDCFAETPKGTKLSLLSITQTCVADFGTDAYDWSELLNGIMRTLNEYVIDGVLVVDMGPKGFPVWAMA